MSNAGDDGRGDDATFALEHGGSLPGPLRTISTGRYGEFHLAGEGGMGLVYLAVDTDLNREVAFKIVRPGSAGGAVGDTPDTPLRVSPSDEHEFSTEQIEGMHGRFLQEAWVTGGLEHPGIVPVYELGQTEAGVPYYTMRFVRGQRTLANAIRDVRRAPFEKRVQLLDPFLKLCDTLRYAHSKGVIHRDLKPDNVALGEFGEVVLLDWGLAKLEGDSKDFEDVWQRHIDRYRSVEGLKTVSGGLIGTPGYMAPEAARGEVESVGRLSDVYSLGVILFEILTGRLPFHQATLGAYLDAVANEDAPDARETTPEMPQALSEICAQALAADPAARISSVNELGLAIREWQAQSLLDREVYALVAEAERALAAAELLHGEELLHQADRAAAALSRAEALSPDDESMADCRERARALRERGIRERERAATRRTLRRVAVLVLAVTAVVAFLVAGALDSKRRQTESALVEKAAALDEVLRLADAKRVKDLLSELDALWPLHPDRAPSLREWLVEARQLVNKRSLHQATLNRLLEISRPLSAEESWKRQVLTDLLSGMERLRPSGENEGGVTAEIERRLELAMSLKRRSIDMHADAWSDTCRAVATSKLYGGLKIVPQLGFVPVGQDPATTLFEFAHVGSGSVPGRNPRTGKLVLKDDSALVFVLIPAAKRPPGDEAPLSAEVGPFLLSKFECTQAQWATVTGGARPSGFLAGESRWGKTVTPRHPVEQVSWVDCSRWLGRHRLVLPTEAQWEHACRAGTATLWFTGNQEISLMGFANVADASFEKAKKEVQHFRGMPTSQAIDDGHTIHAPVGTFAANRFGLHDVHGNVLEWCVDAHLGPQGNSRVSRGGAWAFPAGDAQSSHREILEKTSRFNALGVRPAASLSGP